VKKRAIVLCMALAIAIVTALAWWNEERESQAALKDMGDDQSVLADVLATSLEGNLSAAPRDLAQRAPKELLPALTAVERDGDTKVFFRRPGTAWLVASDGAVVRSDVLEVATDGSVRLTREQAAAVGLPARTALAGVRTLHARDGAWAIVVVATAQVQRDRQQHARWRLTLSVLLGSGLVLAFGGLAMRRQRKELELQHELAVARLRNERDEKLVRADKLAVMGALATGIAHEVATPLGVILGRSEQLLPKQPDDRAKRAVEAIAEQATRIDAVIRSFLALARGAQPALTHHDAGAMVRAAVSLVEHRFEKAGVRLTTEVPDDLRRVHCEARLFEQVLVNLLLNACDACEEGGSVTLRVEQESERMVFAVLDDGVGIPHELVAQTTEPFFTTKAEGKGTGLGLAIVNEIVKHHCGSLALEPRPGGRGTRAAVEIPLTGGAVHA